MCGIAGFIGIGDKESLEKMTSALAHRGPDDESFFIDLKNRIFLGHRRLSIIDLETGHQPIWNEDHTMVMIFNGEIYNHHELRQELKDFGHRFFTDHADSEVLIHGYEQWGEELPSHLNGMWAFALVDYKKQLLFLSRDRFGKKPLYYFRKNNLMAFASEIHALKRHYEINPSIDSLSLQKFFAYGFIPAPRSLYRDIFKVPAGHNLIYSFKDQSIKSKPYWDLILEPFDHVPDNPVPAWSEELIHLIRKAVERRLAADVPLGLFLSGGIDSSAILEAATHYRIPREINTFSIGFVEKSFDESQYAHLIASTFGSSHHHEIFSSEKAKELVPEVLTKLDEPIADGSIIPTFLLSRFTRRHVKVALSGDGGDELFAGYDPFKALFLSRLYDGLIPRAVRRKIRTWSDLFPVSQKNMSFDFRMKRTLRGLSYEKPYWNPVWLSPLEPHEISDFFQQPIRIEELYSEALHYWHDCPMKHLVDKTLFFYTKMYLQDNILTKVDRASMMVALEVRSPFLDRDLVDFVRHIPWQWKYRFGTCKFLLKKALSGLLPNEIIRRPKKGFGIPLTRWIADEWETWKTKGVFTKGNHSLFDRLQEEHFNGKADHRLFLWAVIVIGKHLEEYA